MINLDIHIDAPLGKVWEALTTNDHLEQWWGKGVIIDPRQGGKFNEPWIDDEGRNHITIGTITALETGKRIQMDWMDAGWPRPTRLDILLSSQNDGTNINIQHSGWEMFDEATRKQQVDQHVTGWKNLMDRLKKYCMQGA